MNHRYSLLFVLKCILVSIRETLDSTSIADSLSYASHVLLAPERHPMYPVAPHLFRRDKDKL